MSNDWVPCSERLPEAGFSILLANAGDPSVEISIGEMTSDGSWYVEEYGYNYTATHWMPLPERPVESTTTPTLTEILDAMTPEQREKKARETMEKLERLFPHDARLDELKWVEDSGEPRSATAAPLPEPLFGSTIFPAIPDSLAIKLHGHFNNDEAPEFAIDEVES